MRRCDIDGQLKCGLRLQGMKKNIQGDKRYFILITELLVQNLEMLLEQFDDYINLIDKKIVYKDDTNHLRTTVSANCFECPVKMFRISREYIELNKDLFPRNIIRITVIN